MNIEGGPHGRPRRQHVSLVADRSKTGGRREPRLLIEVPLEGRPRVTIDAAELGDEIRLRAWARRAERRLARAIADAMQRAL